MFARTPHLAAGHFVPDGTMNVHRVPFPGRPPAPGFPPGPRFAVSIPSEKLEPSGPGSLIAEPDCPAAPELSHTETVNDLVVSISGAEETANWPGAVIAS